MEVRGIIAKQINCRPAYDTPYLRFSDGKTPASAIWVWFALMYTNS
jgi:hypothetical protein